MNRKLLALVTLAVLVVVVVIVLLINGCQPRENTTATAPAPAPAATVDQPSSTPSVTDPNIPDPVPETIEHQLTTASEGFIQAYTTQRWDDPSATTWLDRASTFTTPQYQDQLQGTYRDANPVSWDRFVEARTIRTVRIDRVDVAQTVAIDKGHASVIVTYQVTTESTGLDIGQQSYNRVLTLKQQGGVWLVDAMEDLVAGDRPAPETVTPPAVPPTVRN